MITAADTAVVIDLTADPDQGFAGLMDWRAGLLFNPATGDCKDSPRSAWRRYLAGLEGKAGRPVAVLTRRFFVHLAGRKVVVEERSNP